MFIVYYGGMSPFLRAFVVVFAAFFSGCMGRNGPPVSVATTAQSPDQVRQDENWVIETVTLGRVDQAILTRAEQATGPVLLWLHGGPGNSAMTMAHHFGPPLEQNFTVVHWDQRGAGRSFRPDETPELSLEQIVADAIELTELLHLRFPHRPIAIVGHSWGSIVGVTVVQQQPELYCAYVGVGQGVSASQTMPIIHEFATQEATRLGDQQALEQLVTMDPPTVEHFGDLTALVTRFGGAYHGQKDWSVEERIRPTSPLPMLPWEQTHEDQSRSIQALAPAIFDLELFEQAPSFDLPVVFAVGRHDRITPASLAMRYHEVLEAPRRHIVWFEESAHNPHIEQPFAFAEALAGLLPGLCNVTIGTVAPSP
ncbi:MAG: alpha/beta hydrolase [Proteobacteria bacterium]|nr:alpha/beta hydrolase [Pseudomonadota bacterium]